MKEDFSKHLLPTDIKLLKLLSKLKKEDIHGFYSLIFKSLSSNQSYAVNDPTPSANKIEALTKVMDYFVSIEEYENCAVVKNIIDKIHAKEE
jgi:hypothetical protein|tara:strand:+ start:944 stop:1219 length:276 start_codon:yes stop_codon:yes gene_type:complete